MQEIVDIYKIEELLKLNNVKVNAEDVEMLVVEDNVVLITILKESE